MKTYWGPASLNVSVLNFDLRTPPCFCLLAHLQNEKTCCFGYQQFLLTLYRQQSHGLLWYWRKSLNTDRDRIWWSLRSSFLIRFLSRFMDRYPWWTQEIPDTWVSPKSKFCFLYQGVYDVCFDVTRVMTQQMHCGFCGKLSQLGDRLGECVMGDEYYCRNSDVFCVCSECIICAYPNNVFVFRYIPTAVQKFPTQNSDTQINWWRVNIVLCTI